MILRRLIAVFAVLGLIAGCTPVRAVGDAAIGVGQVALGAADVVI